MVSISTVERHAAQGVAENDHHILWAKPSITYIFVLVS